MAEAVHDVLDGESGPATVRSSWDDLAATRRVLQQLGNSGLLATLVAEDHGGLGLDEGFLPLALEQVGYFAAPGPINDTVTIAAPLLASARHAQAADVLSGDVLVAVGLGRTGPIPHADGADLFLLDTPEGPRAFGREDVEVSPLTSVDRSRRLAAVRQLGPGEALDQGQVERSLERATLGTAAELVGLSQRMLDMTVEYVQQREQFGSQIGAFQAVKHQLADCLLRIAFARPAALRAGATLAEGADSASRDVSTAKAAASDAVTFVSERSIQCHGAIGYTVEYDLHLFAKRGWALREDHGGATDHRERLADLLDIPAVGA